MSGGTGLIGRGLVPLLKTGAVPPSFADDAVVGTERLLASGYFRATMRQEELIQAGSIPYTILRATQFFESVAAIGQSSVVGDEIHLSPAMMQPIAAADVSTTLADIAVAKPLNGMCKVEDWLQK